MIEYLVQGLVLRRPCDTAQLMLFASPSVLKPKQLLSHSITETVPHEHAEWTRKKNPKILQVSYNFQTAILNPIILIHHIPASILYALNSTLPASSSRPRRSRTNSTKPRIPNSPGMEMATWKVCGKQDQLLLLEDLTTFCCSL